MAAAGGHWVKMTHGSYAGKRLFVPKNWTPSMVAGVKSMGKTPSQIEAQWDKEHKAGLKEAGLAPKPAKSETAELEAAVVGLKELTGGGLDLFGNPIAKPAPKTPKAKTAKPKAARPQDQEPLKLNSAPVGTFQVIGVTSFTSKLGSQGLPLAKPSKANYKTFAAAQKDAIRVSAYHNVQTTVYRSASSGGQEWKVGFGANLGKDLSKLQPGTIFYSYKAGQPFENEGTYTVRIKQIQG